MLSCSPAACPPPHFQSLTKAIHSLQNGVTFSWAKMVLTSVFCHLFLTSWRYCCHYFQQFLKTFDITLLLQINPLAFHGFRMNPNSSPLCKVFLTQAPFQFSRLTSHLPTWEVSQYYPHLQLSSVLQAAPFFLTLSCYTHFSLLLPRMPCSSQFCPFVR